MNHLKRKPTKEEIKNALLLFSSKNDKFLELVKRFDLEITEITQQQKTINNNQKTSKMKTSKTVTKNFPKKKTEEKKESKTIYPKGVFVFNPHEKAPDFVVANLFINIEMFKDFIEERSELLHESEQYGTQLKMQLLKGESGLYLSVDTYGLDK